MTLSQIAAKALAEKRTIICRLPEWPEQGTAPHGTALIRVGRDDVVCQKHAYVGARWTQGYAFTTRDLVSKLWEVVSE